MNFDNKIKIILDANSKNESVARVSVASFATQLNPTLQELEDIKMAVSEAVTNSIIHGYNKYSTNNKPNSANDEQIETTQEVVIICGIVEDTLHIEIEDKGVGIKNIEKAMEPLYTSKPNMERSGMGFTVMEAFMDHIEVISEESKGTRIILRKRIIQ
ncbi:MAG: anti-sigma F factor [bacterium]